MDRLESMRVFVAVASAGSFSAAGRQLRTPLPTVSRKVSELESHLGAKLFVRSTRKPMLTEVGQSYLVACSRILEDIDQADRDASGQYREPHGELTLTAPIVFGRLHVLPVTTEFLKTHPKVSVRLLLSDRSLDVVGDRLDAAVRIGTLPDSQLVASSLGQLRTVVCASPAYLKDHGVPKSPDDLNTHHCVTFAEIADADHWTFRDRRSVPVRSRLVVSTADAAVDGAIAGIGLARVMSYQVVEAVRAGKLVIVLKRFELPPVTVNLLYARDLRQTAKLRAFLDFAAPLLRARVQAATI
jgi:DNA-binding transcriptional LysR family regulator